MLYLTPARSGLERPTLPDGALFACEGVGARGRPAFRLAA
jgi:hypothetical protein